MRIEQLMTESPKICQSSDTLAEAVQIMCDHDCGCLPVTEEDGSQRVVGMITDRDICTAAALHGKPLREIRVEEAMTRKVRACNPGDALREAEAIMGETGVRRLPVVDEADQLLGLLSLADIAREAAREHWWERQEITEAEVGEVLAMICQPRDKGGAQMNKNRILVVDDEKDIVEYLTELLEDNGYEVTPAYSGVEAMKAIARERPDLILLDLMMPEETGTGLYRKLHHKKEYRDIPVIVISGLAGSYLAVSKSVPVIEKPPDEELVLWEVAKALQAPL